MENINSVLFDQIARFQIGSEGDSLTFSGRLCRENSWSELYANRCVEEYKKFIYLAMVSDIEVTPSDEVDQVWHLHLTYTRSYWGDLCQKILKRPLHHGPTKGGEAESNKYRSQYQATLDKYLEVFGESPPQDIWPKCEERFNEVDKFVRLNTTDYYLVKKPLLSLLGVIALTISLAACVQSDSDTWGVYVILGIVCLYIGYKLFKFVGRNKNKSKNGAVGGCGTGGKNNDGGSDGGSGCSGCGGCGG